MLQSRSIVTRIIKRECFKIFSFASWKLISNFKFINPSLLKLKVRTDFLRSMRSYLIQFFIHHFHSREFLSAAKISASTAELIWLAKPANIF